jgi:nitrogen fixation protein NifB
MLPEVAVSRALSEISSDSRIRIVAVSGPGEPLANSETFDTFELIRENTSNIHFCLSTNGTLLSERVQWLQKMGFKTVTVSMSTANPSTAARIYEWAVISKNRLTGERMGEIIVDSQIRGISEAADAGLIVKVNSILIPGFNQEDIVELAESIAEAGALMQNIVPLVPNGRLLSLLPPCNDKMEETRQKASKHIEQFRHCKQCRSDVVGLPGYDVIL